LAEGTSVGAFSLVTKPTKPWGIYYGVPAKRKKERSRRLLECVKSFTALELSCEQLRK